MTMSMDGACPSKIDKIPYGATFWHDFVSSCPYVYITFAHHTDNV